MLQSAGALIPVPLIQDAIEVALKIIEICEVCKIPPRKGCEMVLKYMYCCQNVSAAQNKAKELQDRVCHLMVVIVDNVTSKNEEGSDEAIVKAAKGIEGDIKDLLRYVQASLFLSQDCH